MHRFIVHCPRQETNNRHFGNFKMGFNELRMGYGPHFGLLFEAWSDAELGYLWVGMEYIIDAFFLSTQILFLIVFDNLYGSSMPLFFN